MAYIFSIPLFTAVSGLYCRAVGISDSVSKSQYFLPIWIIIVLFFEIWEISRNKLKKHSVTKSCSDLSPFEQIVLVTSKILLILGPQPRISKVFLNHQNNFFSQLVRTILVTKYRSCAYLESAPTASLRCSSGVDVAVGTNRGAWYDIFGVGGAL